MQLENTSRIGTFLTPPLNLDPNHYYFPGLKQQISDRPPCICSAPFPLQFLIIAARVILKKMSELMP